MLGGMELSYFQLTPLGQQRIQAGQLPTSLSPSSKKVLRDIVELGGTAEWDEMKLMGGFNNPQILKSSMKRLVDLGYITPVQMQVQQNPRG